MKKFTLSVLSLGFLLSLSGCGLVEDAFKAGVIFAVIIAVIVGLLIWVLRLSWKLLTKFFPGIRLWYNEHLAGYED